MGHLHKTQPTKTCSQFCHMTQNLHEQRINDKTRINTGDAFKDGDSLELRRMTDTKLANFLLSKYAVSFKLTLVTLANLSRLLVIYLPNVMPDTLFTGSYPSVL